MLGPDVPCVQLQSRLFVPGALPKSQIRDQLWSPFWVAHSWMVYGELVVGRMFLPPVSERDVALAG